MIYWLQIKKVGYYDKCYNYTFSRLEEKNGELEETYVINNINSMNFNKLKSYKRSSLDIVLSVANIFYIPKEE